MCIAIIKPSGVLPPSMDIFRRCFERNPDGAGLAYSDGRLFHIKKGLMTLAEFEAKYNEVIAPLGEAMIRKRPMAFHFRIGTHGSKNDPKHTHPFPISGRIETLESLDTTSKHIAMHNGIMSSWGTSNWGTVTGPKISDTMEFIKDFVRPVQNLLGTSTFFDSKDAQDLISNEVPGQRFVIMEPDGRFVYWGGWIKDKASGLLYSNKDYEETKYVPVSYAGKSYYDYDDGYWEKTSRDYLKKDDYEGWKSKSPPVEDVDFEISLESLDDFPIIRTDVDDIARKYGLIPIYGQPVFHTTTGYIQPGLGEYVYIESSRKRAYLWDGMGTFEFYTRYVSYQPSRTYQKMIEEAKAKETETSAT